MQVGFNMFSTKYVDNFSEFYSTREEFIKARYAEAKVLCASERDLDIDIDTYQQLIDKNIMTVLELFDDEEFIGYCSILISPAVLSVGRVDAKIDHIALDEEYRDRGYASLVLEEVENLLKTQGVDELSIVLPPTKTHNKFAENNGYKKNVVLHTKSLEGE